MTARSRPASLQLDQRLAATGHSPPSAGRGCRPSARRRGGAAAGSAAPRRSRRRRHSRRRWRSSRRARRHRRAAPPPCPCRGTPTGRAGNRGWSARGGGRGRPPRPRGRAAAGRPGRVRARRRRSRRQRHGWPSERIFDVAGECHAKCDSNSRAKRARGFAGKAGMPWAGKPRPPATPITSAAVPNRRLMKFSVKSTLWMLVERQQSPGRRRHQPRAPAAGRRRAHSGCGARPASGSRSPMQIGCQAATPTGGTNSELDRGRDGAAASHGQGEAPDIGGRNAANGIGADRRANRFREDRGNFGIVGEGGDDMIALGRLVAGEALQLELAPAESGCAAALCRSPLGSGGSARWAGPHWGRHLDRGGPGFANIASASTAPSSRAPPPSWPLTRTDITLPIRRVQAAIIGTGSLATPSAGANSCCKAPRRRPGYDHQIGRPSPRPLAAEPEVAAVRPAARLGWRSIAAVPNDNRVSTAYGWAFTIAVSLLLIPAAIQFASCSAGIGGVALIAWGDRDPLAKLAALPLCGRRRPAAVRAGWWRRRLVVAPLANIQSVDLTENFIGRRFGVAGLAIGVASGRGFSAHGIEALPRETARALRARLLSPYQHESVQRRKIDQRPAVALAPRRAATSSDRRPGRPVAARARHRGGRPCAPSHADPARLPARSVGVPRHGQGRDAPRRRGRGRRDDHHLRRL